MGSNLVSRLKAIVGSEHLTDSYVDRRAYAYVNGFGGDFSYILPDVVVLPESTEEVSKIILLANETKTPVVPRGAATNMLGVNVANRGGIMMDMSLMNKTIDIDEGNMIVTADAGCSVYRIMHDLDKIGLEFPVAPLFTSAVQIGASAACNISGLHMTRFGRIGDNITGLEVVLPTGEIVTLGSGAYKSGLGFYHRYTGGPDLIGLFVNACGATGVITKVAVKVRPKPNFLGYLAYGWRRDQARDLTAALDKVQRNPVYDCYLTNHWFYTKRAEVLGLPPDAHFLACFTIDGHNEEALAFERDRVTRISEEHYGVAISGLAEFLVAPPHYRIWTAVTPWIKREQTFYFFGPVRKFADIYDLFEEVTTKYGFWNYEHRPMWFSFHGRNTINPFPMIMMNNPSDQEELDRIRRWWDEFNTRVVEMGCTQYNLGDAFPKENYEALGPLWDLTRKIKRFLDPNDIMNPSETYSGDTA